MCGVLQRQGNLLCRVRAILDWGNFRRTKFLKIKTCCNRAFLKRALNFSLREWKPGTTKETERYCWEITLAPGGWGIPISAAPYYYLLLALAVGIHELNVCVVKESVLTNINISRRSFCVCAHWRQQLGGSLIGPDSFDFMFYCQAETFVLVQYRLLNGYLCSSLRVVGNIVEFGWYPPNFSDLSSKYASTLNAFFALSCMCIRGAVWSFSTSITRFTRT